MSAEKEVEVVRLGPDDAPDVVRLEAVFGSPAIDEDRARRMLSQDGHFVFGARIGDRLVALAVGMRIARWRRDKMLLYEIDTDPAFRRRGAARALIGTLLRTCAHEDMQSMFVITEEANQASMRLYESTGATRAHPDDVLWHWEPD